MKAQVLHRHDTALTAPRWVTLKEVPDPRRIKSTDVIVRVGGSGVGTTKKGLDMTRANGRYYIVGYGENINIATVDLIPTERNIIGNLVGTWAELNELMALAYRGLVELATKHYRLSEANQALQDLHHGKIKGRAVLVP